MVMYNMISTGHARALIPIEDPKLQYETAAIVYDQKLSVRGICKGNSGEKAGKRGKTEASKGFIRLLF